MDARLFEIEFAKGSSSCFFGTFHTLVDRNHRIRLRNYFQYSFLPSSMGSLTCPWPVSFSLL